MEVYNQTRFVHERTMGMDVAGREFLSLVIKGTYDFPQSGTPQVAEKQRPLVMADVPTGVPGASATLWETDFAFRKHHAEVIVQGVAYAPGGKPVEKVRVGVKVGDWLKQFDVIGYREWRGVGPTILATRPVPFQRQAFGYDTAFGGPDRLDPEDDAPAVYAPNPTGRGFATVRNQGRITGLALPNTQEVGVEISSPYEKYDPMALGPIGRGWPERLKWAGTYDADWIDNIFPFLPPDFDETYYQSVGPDQWLPALRSGAQVIIGNMTPAGRETFALPETGLPVVIFRGGTKCVDQIVQADTLTIDTEARQFSLLWRVEARVKRHMSEFTEGWIGAPTDAMLRARAEGRRYIRAVAVGPAEDEIA